MTNDKTTRAPHLQKIKTNNNLYREQILLGTKRQVRLGCFQSNESSWTRFKTTSNSSYDGHWYLLTVIIVEEKNGDYTNKNG